MLINSTIPIDIKAKIDINQNFYFFGRAGIALVQQDITSSWLFPIGNSSKWQPTFGGGFGYNFNQSLSLELSYNFVNRTNEQTRYKHNTARFQNISIGLNYAF